MAYPTHWLLSFGGTLASGADIWTNNIRFATGDVPVFQVVDETAMVENFATELAARFALPVSSGGLGYGSSVALEWVKFNEIDSAGRYADLTTTHVHELTSPVFGSGSSNASSILQVALAVSWMTAAARGPASKGRIFIPMPGVVVANGTITDAQCLDVATHWGYMLDEWANLPGFDLTDIVPAVVSNTTVEGASRGITGVRVGNVPDTQRRRRNALTEAYSSAPVEADPV